MIDTAYYQIRSFENIDENAVGAAVDRLTERYFGENVKGYKKIGSGTFGLVYRAETEKRSYVVKFYSVKGIHRTQALEIETLRKCCAAKIPEVYFVHDADAEIPFEAVGMEFVEGVPLVDINPNYYKKESRLALADEITTALHSIHRATNDKYGYLEDLRYDNWLDFYKPFARDMRDWVAEHGSDPKHKMPEELWETIDYAFEHFDRIFDQPISPPTLIHNDLCVCNIMIDKKTLKLTALIDPYRTMYGDVDYELQNLTNITGNRFYLYDTYKKKYGVSKNSEVKVAFYALFNEIYFYRVTGLSFEYIYPFMIARLKREMKRYFKSK